MVEKVVIRNIKGEKINVLSHEQWIRLCDYEEARAIREGDIDVHYLVMRWNDLRQNKILGFAASLEEVGDNE